MQRLLSDASDRACSVRPYFYLQLFLRMHSDQTEFCVSYDFLIASSRAPIVKALLGIKDGKGITGTISDILKSEIF